MIEKIINVEKIDSVLTLFGSFDENINLLQKHYDVVILGRGGDIKITGAEENVEKASQAVDMLLSQINKGEPINEQSIRYVISMIEEGAQEKIEELSGNGICLTTTGKVVKPKTLGQKKYIDAIKSNTIVLGVGPAGTGKTYLAVAMAVKAFKAHEITRIILTRPAVEAGRSSDFFLLISR